MEQDVFAWVCTVIARIDAAEAEIAAFCRRWNVSELALFGSVLRDDFLPDSDIDVLVSFKPGAAVRLHDLLRMEAELSALFGRKVDLGTRRSVESDSNYLRRREISWLGAGDLCGRMKPCCSICSSLRRRLGISWASFHASSSRRASFIKAL
jgi:predicted nucleotidyltransferase